MELAEELSDSNAKAFMRFPAVILRDVSEISQTSCNRKRCGTARNKTARHYIDGRR